MGMDTIQLVMDIESRFDISIPDEVASECETVGQLCDAVVRRIYLTEAQRPNLHQRVFEQIKTILIEKFGVPAD